MKVWMLLVCVGPLLGCGAEQSGSAAPPSSASIGAAGASGNATASDSGQAGAMGADAGPLVSAAESGRSPAMASDAGAVDGAANSGGADAMVANAGSPASAATPGTFTDVLAILTARGCGGCHGAEPGEGDGGLSFFTSQRDATYAALVGVQSAASGRTVCAGKTYVVPGSPETSLLYDKVANATPSCGGHMPASGMPLSAAELASLSSWITAGARKD